MTTSPDAPIALLYVEDDDRLGELTTTFLTRNGLQVHRVTSGEDALACIAEVAPDVVLLDVMLPGIDGREVCRQIRAVRDVPIIMVSALDHEVDLVMGLEYGADDYVTKPFSPREVLARIRAQARRARGKLVPDAAVPNALRVGTLVLDPSTYRAHLGERDLELTTHEFALLHALAMRRGRVLSRDQLIGLTRERDDEVFERAIDVQISRLRQKLGDDGRKPTWIKTVRGLGYTFVGGPS